jgi:hypothetical protein
LARPKGSIFNRRRGVSFHPAPTHLVENPPGPPVGAGIARDSKPLRLRVDMGEDAIEVALLCAVLGMC